MSTSTSAPSSSTSISTQTPINQNDPSRARIVHTATLISVVICPALILLPPRKLDVYTLALATGTLLGGNQLAFEYTGRSIVDRVQDTASRIQAERRRGFAAGKEERVEKQRYPINTTFGDRNGEGAGLAGRINVNENLLKKASILEEVERAREVNERKGSQTAMRADTRSQWKKERDKREKDALEEGRGYGDLIMDQIWEVWNWGKGKTNETKEISEKVVETEKKKDEEKRGGER